MILTKVFIPKFRKKNLPTVDAAMRRAYYDFKATSVVASTLNISVWGSMVERDTQLDTDQTRVVKLRIRAYLEKIQKIQKNENLKIEKKNRNLDEFLKISKF